MGTTLNPSKRSQSAELSEFTRNSNLYIAGSSSARPGIAQNHAPGVALAHPGLLMRCKGAWVVLLPEG